MWRPFGIQSLAVPLLRALLLFAAASASALDIPPQPAAQPFGIAKRPLPRAYLNMPRLGTGEMPALLSQTGVFSNTARLEPSAAFIPYDLIVAFWSDGARKSRMVAVPRGAIAFSPTGEWKFPDGTVFVKTFFLPTDATDPTLERRLETRLLVRDSQGGVYGVTYKWRPDGSDADLLAGSLREAIPIRAADGALRQQTWYYPSRQDCMTCHTPRAGGVLGVKTRQLNHAYAYPSGISDNELRTWNHLGLFAPAIRPEQFSVLPALAAAQDTSRSIEDRARSYLDANCSHCHQPGGTVANFDARYDTPLSQQALIDGPVLIDQGVDRPRVFSPHDIWRSIAFMRVNSVGDIQMPPLARETIDTSGVKLLAAWIDSMPGRPVLPPPRITPSGGTFEQSVDVSLLSDEPGAQIHYTLDGSVPGTSDPLYEGPIKLTAPTVLRARSYKEGFTRSIANQEVFIIGK
jgi:uncharacterized repeat protein (TIGR03806 family)